jgi:hypothetical protein
MIGFSGLVRDAFCLSGSRLGFAKQALLPQISPYSTYPVL